MLELCNQQDLIIRNELLIKSLLCPDMPLESVSVPHYGPGLWLSDLYYKDSHMKNSIIDSIVHWKIAIRTINAATLKIKLSEVNEVVFKW